MAAKLQVVGLRLGLVDPQKEHFRLYYTSTGASLESKVLIAAIGKPKAGLITVDFRVDRSNAPENAIESSWREIIFYFFELHKSDAWSYAHYHCGTAANFYSNMHWAFYAEGEAGA